MDHLLHQVQGEGVPLFGTIEKDEGDSVFNLELNILVAHPILLGEAFPLFRPLRSFPFLAFGHGE